MNFEIGQIFEKEYPPAVADWCNENGKAYIEEIEPINDIRRFQIVAVPEPTADEIEAEQLQAEITAKEQRLASIKDKLLTAVLLDDTDTVKNLKAEYRELLNERV